MDWFHPAQFGAYRRNQMLDKDNGLAIEPTNFRTRFCSLQHCSVQQSTSSNDGGLQLSSVEQRQARCTVSATSRDFATGLQSDRLSAHRVYKFMRGFE